MPALHLTDKTEEGENTVLIFGDDAGLVSMFLSEIGENVFPLRDLNEKRKTTLDVSAVVCPNERTGITTKSQFMPPWEVRILLPATLSPTPNRQVRLSIFLGRE